MPDARKVLDPIPAIKMEEVNAAEAWTSLLRDDLGGHLFQSWEWGTHKEQHGWEASRWVWKDENQRTLAAAQILKRSISMPGTGSALSLLYCPRGPQLNWSDQPLVERVLNDLSEWGKQRGSMFMKIDPEIIMARGSGVDDLIEDAGANEFNEALGTWHWSPAREQVQFRSTFLLDLKPDEDELLAGMKQKTRYNVRLASRRDVSVRAGTVEDLSQLYDMYLETAVRDGFVIRAESYYLEMWRQFLEAGLAQPLIAEVEGEPIAAILVYRYGARAWYLYGMSTDRYRERMPNYLLQWEAIRWAREKGCLSYDFWGAPEAFNAEDPLWGLYRFKSGFGADIVQWISAQDRIFKDFQFSIYSSILPRALSFARWLWRQNPRNQR